MYLKFIGIKNIGAIEELKIEPSFTEKGNPKPIVIVGENGTGKTILLSSIVDSFYEIGCELFNNIGKREGISRSFYKVQGGVNLRTNKRSGFVALQFQTSNSRNVEYVDKINATQEEVLGLCHSFVLQTQATGKYITSLDDDFKNVLRQEWKNQAHYYQPAYRYEEPYWKNPTFHTEALFDLQQKFGEITSKEIEIVSSFEKNKSFVMDIVLDRHLEIGLYVYQLVSEFSDHNKVNENLFKLLTLNSKETKISHQIDDVIQKIKGMEHIRFGINSRHGGSRLTICREDGKPIMPNIDCLSLGEGILFNMFINIIRHCDPSKNEIKDFQGIVVIDEIDTHLHSNLQSKVLPSLIKLFPKIQFILTTHSPLFVLGMQKEFKDDGFDLIEMPTGEKITAEKFGEFKEAYRVLAETKKFEDDLRKQVENSHKPLVFVEGKTDVRYIKKALELYGKESLLQDLDIEQIGHEDKSGAKNSNDEALKGAKRFLESNPDFSSKRVLILHDPETKNVPCGNFGEKANLKIEQMPRFENNPIKTGIENLFSLDFIERIYKTQKEKKEILLRIDHDEELMGMQITDKQKMCDRVCEKGVQEDFKNFKVIIEILEDFLQDKDSNNGESK